MLLASPKRDYYTNEKKLKKINIHKIIVRNNTKYTIWRKM